MNRHLEALVLVLVLGGAIALNIVDPFLYLVIIVHLAAIPAIAYPAVYRNSPWRTGPTGRALMNKARSVALLFALAIIGHWWTFPGYEYLYNVVVTYLGLSISYQLLVMYRLKKQAQLDERIRPYTRKALQ